MSLVRRRAFTFLLALFCLGASTGCEDSGKVSAGKVRAHIKFVTDAVGRDVGEVRRGLPEGAKLLAPLFKEAHPERPGVEDTREALLAVRADVNDLDSAKSTFFLIAAPDGTILRNNLEQDEMAGKNLFEVYPEAKQAKKPGYFEFAGSWDVARGVNNRDDAQWVAAAAISLEQGTEAGFLVAGWSWSSYAYRLEMSLRSDIMGSTKEGDKVPLLYVYVLADGKSFGTPVSPVVNGQELIKRNLWPELKGEEPLVKVMEIDRRSFGVAVQKTPLLGPNVAVAVLRSET